MLKKLRVKFVALNMATVAVVLAVVFTAICVINHKQSTDDVYSVLDNAISRAADAAGATGKRPFSGAPDAGETLPKDPSAQDQPASDQPASDQPASDQPASDQPEPAPPEIGGKRENNEPAIPVAVCVFQNDEDEEEDDLVVIPAMTTASIAEDVLDEVEDELSERGDGSGFLSAFDLFYVKRSVGGATYVAFADASSASSWQTLALTLAGVGAAALAAFLVISVFFARWALEPVEAAWEQQQRFVADASHELKTPLTVILANMSILRSHPERSIASQNQWVESTQTEAEHMQELVCDMLDLAKPAAPRAHAERSFENVNLTELMEKDLLQFESVAFERSIKLTASIDPNVSISGDPSRLHRLASTLIDNACKYANEGGTIAITLRRCARHVELSVRNTGTPIAPEDLPHVFDRFYRADKARTRTQGSYGLGLAIAREIAEEHGGTIAVASAPCEGTVFTVQLPMLSSLSQGKA